MAAQQVRKAADELCGYLRKIKALSSQVYVIFNDAQLDTLTKGVSFPCAGVVYDGMVAAQEQGATSKIGASADIVFTIYLRFRERLSSNTDSKLEAIDMLDSLRQTILGATGPTGHKWKFRMEGPMPGGGGNDVSCYLQRWSIPVQLT